MSGFLDKVEGIFFRGEEEDEQTVNGEQNTPLAMPNERPTWNDRDSRQNVNRKNNLMSIPVKETFAVEMVLVKAVSYDDLQEIANHIKNKRVVVVNFEDMDKAVAQRMVDFLSGAVFSLDGQSKKVSGGTLIFSSNNVDLTGHIMDGDGYTDDKGSFKPYPWMKK
ncbi:MAG: cell division protein SepF [Clostridiales bacterium]